MLDRVLKTLPESDDPALILGISSLDDAGVYQLRNGPTIVQTLDFFTPVVDDPYAYGAIAAANALSDIYAMGGRPVTAMNIIAFPAEELPESILTDILRGAFDLCSSAEVAVVGGHSVTDREIKFGLSVTGVVDPDKLMTKNGGKPGDILILTKPLGSGLISNALINDASNEKDVKNAIEVMSALNRNASESATNSGCTCATDITGFGLLGHVREVALASGVAAVIQTNQLPILPGAMEIASSGSFFSGGERRNRQFVEESLEINEGVSRELQRITADPQTSGGLLVALPADSVNGFLKEMNAAGENGWVIGKLDHGMPGNVILL